MKKIIIAPLFTMLLASCGTISPSQNDSNIDSQISSSSTATSSNTSSSVSSTSSSEELVSNRKVQFNQIGSLVAQVVDAKAMGIVNSKDRTNTPLSGRRNNQDEDQNYMVKVTETYNPNTQITEDQTIQVTFTSVTNAQTTELQTGTSTHVATADPITIERVTDLPGNIVITNVIGYEFRLLSDESVVQDWMSSDLETIEFIFDEALTDLVIESRSLNAFISFTTFEDFTYTIKQGEQVIYEAILDNNPVDNNEAMGAMTISGLIEGLTYEVTYAGYQVIETITQDEVDGQVDKLYVLNQFTFVSFVPLNLNPRPQDQDLDLDYDGTPMYDKTGFYSDSTRQSFVVDNNTGLIYKIEGINIASLSGGCVSVQDNPFPFDIRINEQNELEFYSLHSNQDLIYGESEELATVEGICLQDQWGNKFIKNKRINFYDETTNTTYFKTDAFSSNLVNYIKTSSNEIIKYEKENQGGVGNLYIVTEDGSLRNFTTSDNFYLKDTFPFYDSEHTLIEVKNGIISGTIKNPQFANSLNDWQKNMSFLSVDPINRYIRAAGYVGYYYNLQFLSDFDLVVYYDSSTESVYSINSAFEKLTSSFNYTNVNINNEFTVGWNVFESALPPDVTGEVVLEGVAVDSITDDNTEYTTFSFSGTQTYEIGLVEDNGKWILKSFLAGTYVPPQNTTITLQPINR
jgi:hypothetical protein